MLFLQHMLSKMEYRGSRIGIVFNGSPLFTGDAGSGESNIRRWIIENDWLECIVALPDKLFFNTSIATYIWILTNQKSEKRRGMIQLINGASFFDKMKRNLGDKSVFISDDFISVAWQRSTLILRRTNTARFIRTNSSGTPKSRLSESAGRNQEDSGRGETIGRSSGDKKGNPKPDSKLRDYERVPLTEDIEDYYQREVKPHLPDSWMERKKDKVGYEINFNRYFYKYTPLRSLNEIAEELLALDGKNEGLLNEVLASVNET